MAEADAETNERLDRIWMVVTLLGVGVGVSLGALMMIMAERRRMAQAVGLGLTSPFAGSFDPQYPQEQLPPRSLGLAMPLAVSPSRQQLTSGRQHHSAARTVTAGEGQMQVLRANGNHAWKIQVRAVSPPGAFAVFSTSNNPAEGIMVVAGDFQEMWLSPGEDLYVQAFDPAIPVIVSVSGGEES